MATKVQAPMRWQIVTRDDARRAGIPEEEISPMESLATKPEELGWVLVREALLESDLDENWKAVYRLVPQEGGFAIAELRVIPKEPIIPGSKPGTWPFELRGIKAEVPNGGLRARTLRKMKLRIHSNAGREILRCVERDHPEEFEWLGLRSTLAQSRRREKSPRGRKPLDDLTLAEIGRLYEERLEAQSRTPIVDIAKATGFTQAKVRSAIYKARSRGIFTRSTETETSPGQWGRVGGKLTPKGLRILHTKGETDGTQRRRTRKAK